jgi:hypothetical protein
MGGFTPGIVTPPSVLSQLRDPDSTVSQRVKIDIQDEILFYMPSSNPLTVITKHLRKKREVENYTFDLLEKDEAPREVTVTGAVTAVATTINLVAGQGIRVAKYDLLMHPVSREVFYVTAIATDALTVATRGTFGSAAAIVDGDTLLILGAAFEDGATSGNLKSVKEDRGFNYTQIFRKAFGFSGRQLMTALYGGSDKMSEPKWQAIEHAKSIEYAFLFGRRAKLTGAGGLPVTTTGGIEYFVKTNVWDLAGNKPKLSQVIEALEEGMKYGRGGNLEGSETKYLFCSPRWQTVLESFGRDFIQYRNSDTIVGLKLGELQTAHGRVVVVRDPILTGAVHGGYAFLLDLNHVKYVNFKGRDTKLMENIQANDADSQVFEFKTDCGAQIELERSHMIFKGLPLG